MPTESSLVRSLRPRARLMLTIGLELISSETVALAELVKNSFDADATTVLVRLTGDVRDGQIAAGEGVVEVLDDGVGMDSDTIAGTWLEPATPNRRSKKTSDAGRRILGEKGIGRFAAAKLARQLEVVSKRDGAQEVRLFLDWEDFEDEEAYLDDVEVDWAERDPIDFGVDGLVADLWAVAAAHDVAGRVPATPSPVRGTLLRLGATRSVWDAARAADVHQTLSRLISPFPSDIEVSTDFRIVLDLPPQFGALSGDVQPPDELQRPHYRLDASIDSAGNAVGEMVLKNEMTIPIGRQMANTDGDPLRCGPFSIHLRVWDRDVDALRLVAPELPAKSVREILDSAAGVNVYRDGFRVLPYGESGDDWLRLDLRRVQSPTRRLSNNQIVGYLLIGRDTNPALLDQTNREGIVQGPAFDDLRSAVIQLLTSLENERYKIRPRREKHERGGLLDRIDLSELRATISARVPNDPALAAMVTDLQSELDQRNADVGEVLARYHRLATLGQLVDRVIHELGQPLAASRQAAGLGAESVAKQLRRQPDGECADFATEIAGRFDTIRIQLGAAGDVIRRIQPFGGRRRGRPPTIKLEDAIADAVHLLDGEIHKVGVVVTIPDGATTVTLDGTELQEVLVNLLTNSLFWLRRVPKGKRSIDVSTSRNVDGSLSVTVEDSGPGIEEADQPYIFDPYFTTRDGGVGLGLSIAGEIVSDFYGGRLELLPPGDLGGARFRATLIKRVG